MAIDKLTSQSLASGAVTSDAIATGAITVDDIPNGEITAAKLHTTAIQDKLGYTPVSPTDLSSGLALKADASSLSTVATSGSYNDLSAKPTLGELAALNTVSASQINNGTVVLSKLGSNALFQTQFNGRTSQHTLVGDSGWVDHLSITFTTTAVCNCFFIYSSSSSYESGTVQGFARLLLDGTMLGYNSAVAKQSTANSAGAGTCVWDRIGVSIGTHTIKVQLRNTSGTWITPYWNVDGQTANSLGVIYYA